MERHRSRIAKAAQALNWLVFQGYCTDGCARWVVPMPGTGIESEGAQLLVFAQQVQHPRHMRRGILLSI